MTAKRHGARGLRLAALHSEMAEGLARLKRLRRLRSDSHERWTREGLAALAWAEPPEPVDKSAWGEGPWQAEPDWLTWTDHATGLPCRIRRNHGGALCGYVGIPDSRAARRQWLRQGLRARDLEVHGGVTFDRQIGAQRWIGFDCSHYMDFSPALAATLRRIGAPSLRLERSVLGHTEQYRDLQYVTAEVERLAGQLAPWAPWPSGHTKGIDAPRPSQSS